MSIELSNTHLYLPLGPLGTLLWHGLGGFHRRILGAGPGQVVGRLVVPGVVGGTAVAPWVVVCKVVVLWMYVSRQEDVQEAVVCKVVVLGVNVGRQVVVPRVHVCRQGLHLRVGVAVDRAAVPRGVVEGRQVDVGRMSDPG